MTLRALVPLASGFEEIEAITIIDVLRRASIRVDAAGLEPGEILATRHTRHISDGLLSTFLNESYDAILLPGGRPGADALAACAPLLEKLQNHYKAGRLTAAICAAPIALDKAGLLSGRTFTCHPAAAAEIQSGIPTGSRVVLDGHLLTGQAAGSAMEFSLAAVRFLCGEDKAAEVNKGLLA